MSHPSEPSPPASSPPALARPGRGPTNPFTPFRKEEVEQSIPARFEQQVRKYPQQTAIQTGRNRLSYETLNRAANRVARTILDCRGEGEEPVAFLLEPGAPQLIALLGILKAGKMYVSLDASFPQARTAAILEDAQPGLIVTDQANLARAHEVNRRACPVVNLDATDPGPAEDPGLSLAAGRPAYILYTSGSGGRPKGVVHSHRNTLHQTLKYTNCFHISPDDRLTLLTALSVATARSDVFGALLNGATLLPFDVKREGLMGLAAWLIRQEVSIYHSVPTVFRHFTGTLTGAETFPHLRLIRLGGEAVSRKDVELYQKHFGPHCLLVNSLGATETTGVCTFLLDRETRLSGARVPVGYPMEDTEVLLLDDAGEVSRDGYGEMAVRSPYLALGYWRDPELTEAAFRPDPERPGVRVYRTGDLGWRRPDGCLEHLGRKDFQVKIRGHRVDVTELEAALLELDGIKEAAVAAREDPAGEQRLVAYCVPAGSPAPPAGALRHALLERFPAFMVPSAWVLLDALPLTPAGKVNRLALPDPAGARQAPANEYVPPRDPLQYKLTAIWENLLHLPRVGVRDDFFDLGGDSLLAVRMLAQVEQVYGRRLPAATLFARPTVESLARAILDHDGGAPSPLVQVQAGTAGLPFFYLHGDVGGGGLYCTPLARQLGPDQPFYALQPHGVFGDEVPLTIEAMAADHLKTLCAVQPEGPYLLGGHCNGALVAFEMARLLEARGKRVGLLVMDQPPPANELGRLAGSAVDVAFSPVHQQSQPGSARLELRGMSSEDRFKVLLATYRRAFAWYRLQPYRGRITLFYPIGYRGGNPDPSRGWYGAAGGGAETYLLPGSHHTSVTAHLSVFADQLRACLRKAQAEAGFVRQDPAPPVRSGA